MDEPPSPLLKLRIPRKTIIVDPNLVGKSSFSNLHCPLRKGIIYYYRDDAILEHNVHSSGKHEPRIIVPKHPSRHLNKISLVPIKGNQILLFAKYRENGYYLHLSIHKIRSDKRVGPTLWSFSGSVDGHVNPFYLEVMESTENALGITAVERFDDHWKLFDISTTNTDASDKFPLIESGRIDIDLKIKSKWNKFVKLSPDRHILSRADLKPGRENEIVDIHYLDSGGTSFSFVTRKLFPIHPVPSSYPPELAFSADGSKFATDVALGRVSIWDIRSEVPLKTFMTVPKPKHNTQPVQYLQFSSGKLGKEALVFVQHDNASHLANIHVIDATSFETEEILPLKLEIPGIYGGVGALFFDPSGETLYAEVTGTLYEWDLRKNEPGPGWWIGE